MAPSTRPLPGIVALILSTWALSGLDASGKLVMQVGVSLFVLCWFRYVGHLLLALVFVIPMRGWGIVHSRCPRAQITRGACMLTATLSFFTTLHYLPQAAATAINFLAPLLVLAVAPWMLGEQSYRSRWIAALIGLIGVLIIIRPSSGLDPVGVAFGLLTACLFTIQYIATRQVAIDDALTTLIWSGGVGSICMTLVLPFLWSDIMHLAHTMNALHWIVLLGTGFWGALGHLLQIRAYRFAPASMLAPFLYLQIISAAGLGWLIWHQFPDAVSWVGIAIICASGIGIGIIERRRELMARRHRLPD